MASDCGASDFFFLPTSYNALSRGAIILAKVVDEKMNRKMSAEMP